MTLLKKQMVKCDFFFPKPRPNLHLKKRKKRKEKGIQLLNRKEVQTKKTKNFPFKKIL